MAKKYIDADLLRKEIERLKTENNNIRCTANGSYCVGYDDAFGDLLSTINSLQQEQPKVDLEKEFEMQADHFPPAIIDELSDDGKIRLHKELYAFARHFAQWGAEHAKKDEIPVPNDLEEAVEEYASDFPANNYEQVIAKYAFKRGAEWQAEQFEKNRLAHCDGLTKEEYDRETAFAVEIIEKEHRQPTFTDAINYGMRLQEKQMMKEAVEGKVFMSFAPGHNQMVMADVDLPTNTKVKVIIVKED